MNLNTYKELLEKENESKKDDTEKLLHNFQKWFNEHIISSVGYSGEIPWEFYTRQDLVRPLIENAGWWSSFYTGVSSWWSMTAKSECETTTYNVKIIPLKKEQPDEQ